MSLTPKQEKLAQLYVELGNAAEAYRRSYNCQNMKKTTIISRAKELLKNGPITALIEKIREEVAERNQVNIGELVQELARVMRFNPKALVDETGSPINLSDLPDEVAKVIQEVKVDEMFMISGAKRVTTKYKLYSKLDAIEKLAKHLGFYEKDNRQKENQQTVIVLPGNGR